MLLAVRSHLMSGDLGRGVVAVEGLRPGDIPHPLGLGSLEEQVRGGLHCAATTHLNSGLGQNCGSQSANVGVHHVRDHSVFKVIKLLPRVLVLEKSLLPPL